MFLSKAVYRLTQPHANAMLVVPTVRAFSSEQVEEATIITEDDNAAEQDFQDWLKKDTPQNKNKVGYRVEKRNAFYKLGYNDKHIPHQGNYAKVKKPRQEAWDNPKYNWPPRMPRPTMHIGKTLINELDKE